MNTRPLHRSFPPVITPAARVLLLGSLPGAASLTAQQYYAHPRNAFWPIMQALLGLPAGLPYADRLAALQQAGIALWDVAAQCERSGSLDTAIRHDTLVPNDIAGLLARHRSIRLLCCNGQSVHALLRRHVLATQTLPPGIRIVTLPSSSPAHARLSLDAKTAAWRAVLEPALKPARP